MCCGGSQGPLGSHPAGLVHGPHMPNQPAQGPKTQRSLKLIKWHTREVKSIHCFPSTTETSLPEFLLKRGWIPSQSMFIIQPGEKGTQRAGQTKLEPGEG